jgi:2-hydroxy-3-keto-5-methylthiopentenyl-1-phosphate phosphatase
MSTVMSKVMEIVETVQVNIKIDPQLKNELKLFAVANGRTLNGMLEKYIREGFEKEKNETN